MREKLKQYVDRLFVQKKQTEQMRELHDEILQNSFDRYDDEIARGKSPEEAYRAAVDGIGDLAPILCDDMAGGSRRNVALAVGLYIVSVIPAIIGGELGRFGDLLGPSLMFLMIAAATVLLVLSAGKRRPQEAEQAEPSERSACPQTPKKSLAWQIGTPIYWVTAALLFFVGCNAGLWMYAWLVFPLFGALSDLIIGCVRMAKGGRGGLRAATGLLWLALLVGYVFLTERTNARLVTWLIFPIGAALRGVLSGIFELVKGENQ